MEAAKADVAALKQHLEQLFPGRWSSGQEARKALLTGIPAIDFSLAKGIERQRITEWVGAPSSGKSSLLRVAIANWCSGGSHVAYIDAQRRLAAADWAFVECGLAGAVVCSDGLPAAQPPERLVSGSSCRGGLHPPACACQRTVLAPQATLADKPKPASSSTPGRFWIFRVPAVTQAGDALPDYFLICDQVVRSSCFDVVILDLGDLPVPAQNKKADRFNARLQQALQRSRTALLIVRDSHTAASSWACPVRLEFAWGEQIYSQPGLSGVLMILPAVQCNIWKDGQFRKVEVSLHSHVANRLFTHTAVPDRRAPAI